MQIPQPCIESQAIVIHRTTFGDERTETLTIAAHDIHHLENESVLGPGRVFNHDDKQSLLGSLSGYMSRDLEFLDAQCLASSHNSLMWYRPRQRTEVNINGDHHTVPMPSLVFLLHKAKLYVAAYRGERRPERNTHLFHCALPNIQDNEGTWCTGGNKLPENPTQSSIEGIERAFFLSPFTHFGPHKPCDENTSMPQFFHSLARSKRFPISQLPEMNVALHRWFTHITTSR